MDTIHTVVRSSFMSQYFYKSMLYTYIYLFNVSNAGLRAFGGYWDFGAFATRLAHARPSARKRYSFSGRPWRGLTTFETAWLCVAVSQRVHVWRSQWNGTTGTRTRCHSVAGAPNEMEERWRRPPLEIKWLRARLAWFKQNSLV